ncbi:hypothetical protein PHMEG_00030433, partial [Phytophthora megakarya]
MTDEATSYQNALARANARISSLNSQLAAASVPALPLASPSVSTTASQTSVTGDELSRVRADLSSAQASVQSEQSRVCFVTSKRDSARAESERRVQCDATAAELNDARHSLDRSRRELDVARAANQPLQDDPRRVNALLVAPAEEHQRDVARIRDLETSSSAAEAAHVSAQADRDSAQASVLPIASRAAIFRSALVSARRSATQRRVQTQMRVCRLTARATGLENALALSQQASQAEVARLEDLIDQSDLAYTERTMTWRRLLREARAGRESARLVRDALVTRLSDMVTAVGGSLDVTQLVRDSESRVEASTYATTPLSPDLDPEIGPTLTATMARITEGQRALHRLVVLRQLCGYSSPQLFLPSNTHLPPCAWTFPTTSSPVPAFWDPTLLTERMVEDFYATRPWDYLARCAQPLTFDAQGPHFQPFIARYDMHLDHWAQAYWESTHEFPVPNTPAWTRCRRRRNSRRSHAGDHLVGTFQLLLILFQAGRVGMDVLLDVMVLLFPPGRSRVGRRYPDLRNSTLEAALADI